MGRGWKKKEGRKTKICRFAEEGCVNGDACPFAHCASELRLHPQAADSGAVSLLTPLLTLGAPGLEAEENVHATFDALPEQGLPESHSDDLKDSENIAPAMLPSAGQSAPPGIFNRHAPAKLPDVNGHFDRHVDGFSVNERATFPDVNDFSVPRGFPLSKMGERRVDPHFLYGASTDGSTMAAAAPLHVNIDCTLAPKSVPPQDMLPMKVAFPAVLAPPQDMVPMKVAFPPMSTPPQSTPAGHSEALQTLFLDRLLSVH